MTTSVVLIAVLVSMVVSMNLAVGVGIGQVGGFTAEFPRLEGETLNIYPAIGESSACFKNTSGADGRPTGADDVGLPILKADIKKANITTLPVVLRKDIRLPNSPAPIDVVRINLTQYGNLGSETVNIGNASLHLHSLRAEKIELTDGAQIRENYSDGAGGTYPILGPDGKYQSRQNSDFGEFSIIGTNATMVNGTARAHFLGFESLTMPNMTLEVEYNPTNPPPLNKTNSNCDGLWSAP